MDDFRPTDSDFQNTLIKGALGFFGFVALRKLLPKAVKLVFSRFVFGLVSQIVLVVIAALLTEKAAEQLSDDGPRSFDR